MRIKRDPYLSGSVGAEWLGRSVVGREVGVCVSRVVRTCGGGPMWRSGENVRLRFVVAVWLRRAAAGQEVE